jgi:CIC family chloride channel protein
MRSEERVFPIVDDDDRLLGVVTLADVRNAPRATWNTMHVSDVMTPTARLATASPNDDAADALDRLIRADVSQLPVLQNGRLVGLLLRGDIARWLELHAHPGPGAGRYAH